MLFSLSDLIQLSCNICWYHIIMLFKFIIKLILCQLMLTFRWAQALIIVVL